MNTFFTASKRRGWPHPSHAISAVVVSVFDDITSYLLRCMISDQRLNYCNIPVCNVCCVRQLRELWKACNSHLCTPNKEMLEECVFTGTTTGKNDPWQKQRVQTVQQQRRNRASKPYLIPVTPYSEYTSTLLVALLERNLETTTNWSKKDAYYAVAPFSFR